MNEMLEKIYNLLIKIFNLLSDKVVKEPERTGKGWVKPDFVVVKGVKFKTHGQYRTNSGKAKGLVVHYTVSGSEATNAQGVVKYLSSKGLGCMVMDAYGTIYIPEGFDVEKSVAYHAGTSSWQGASGISRYCMGMEICNWGLLNATSKKKVKKLRKSSGKHNIKAGEYEPYTPEQEEALVNFILWQKDSNPEFKIDWVVGHDEIAPTRKQDPGASLSMSMPEFREYLNRRVTNELA